jgi:hypothetical protein
MGSINPDAMLPVSGIPRLSPMVDELLSVGNMLVVLPAIVFTMASA